MDLETLWYETFPYLCAIGGLGCLLQRHGSSLLRVSGVLLLIAAVAILRLRWTARRAATRRMPPAAEAARYAAAGSLDDE